MKSLGKSGNLGVIIAMAMVAVVFIIFVGASYAKNANGILNWLSPDVTSGTPQMPGCEPKKYLVEMHGTLDLINDFLGLRDGYEITYIDAHINDIDISQKLGIFSDSFDAKVCLYDVLANVGGTPKQVSCERIEDDVTKGRIENYPFKFTYNLYDNNCDGQVDDHTFNLVAEVSSGDGFERHEKTVAIVNGQPVYQNADY